MTTDSSKPLIVRYSSLHGFNLAYRHGIANHCAEQRVLFVEEWVHSTPSPNLRSGCTEMRNGFRIHRVLIDGQMRLFSRDPGPATI